LARSLTHSLTRSLTHSRIIALPRSPAYSLTLLHPPHSRTSTLPPPPVSHPTLARRLALAPPRPSR
jgi:hypothetical protein